MDRAGPAELGVGAADLVVGMARLNTADDRRQVAELLGREPAGAFDVVVRHRDGSPLVIANAPLLDDGTPMPTRFWLVGEPERTWVGRLESTGAVDRAESEVDGAALADAHARYAAERDALIAATHTGPRPSGGVGGTRRGVKCLHAHYAWWLAGGDDPVGEWVSAHLAAEGSYPRSTGHDRCRRREPPRGRRLGSVVAAIDCGTNSTRLLVARRGSDGALESIERHMRITRLGQGVDATGQLAPEAIDRTVTVLRDYRAIMDRHGAEQCGPRPPPRPVTPPTVTRSSGLPPRRSAHRSSCSPAPRRGRCPSPARRLIWPGDPVPIWSSTSVEARPSSSRVPSTSEVGRRCPGSSRSMSGACASPSASCRATRRPPRSSPPRPTTSRRRSARRSTVSTALVHRAR